MQEKNQAARNNSCSNFNGTLYLEDNERDGIINVKTDLRTAYETQYILVIHKTAEQENSNRAQ